jgi:hypothetical protein
MVFLLGIAFAIALQLHFGGWWLDDRERVRAGFVGVIVLAFLTASSLVHAAALWLGVNVGLTGVLFWWGGGNLWPIVMVFGGGITGAGVGIGWAPRQLLALLLAEIKKGRAA